MSSSYEGCTSIMVDLDSSNVEHGCLLVFYQRHRLDRPVVARSPKYRFDEPLQLREDNIILNIEPGTIVVAIA